MHGRRCADRRRGLRLAALFGLADGVGFLIGAGLGWVFLSEGVPAVIEWALVVLGVYLSGRRRETAATR